MNRFFKEWNDLDSDDEIISEDEENDEYEEDQLDEEGIVIILSG